MLADFTDTICKDPSICLATSKFDGKYSTFMDGKK